MAHPGSFRVAVTKDYLVFASAHFITFTGHRCEPLHGHNYRVGVTLEGTLHPETFYVVDFSEIKRLMRRLCDEIDHKVLLAAETEKMELDVGDDVVTVRMNGAVRYVFPREDCALLPLPNTTVEMLAEYLARRVRSELSAAGGSRLTTIELEVEENFGQSAVYRAAWPELEGTDR